MDVLLVGFANALCSEDILREVSVELDDGTADLRSEHSNTRSELKVFRYGRQEL